MYLLLQIIVIFLQRSQQSANIYRSRRWPCLLRVMILSVNRGKRTCVEHLLWPWLMQPYRQQEGRVVCDNPYVEFVCA